MKNLIGMVDFVLGQQVVSEIKGNPVTMGEALKMAENNFGQIYAWVKADVVTKLLEEKTKL